MGERDYHVIVEGELSPAVARAFEGMQVISVAGTTVIAGAVRDQAALHALLRRVGDLGLTLVSVAALPDHTRRSGAQLAS